MQSRAKHMDTPYNYYKWLTYNTWRTQGAKAGPEALGIKGVNPT